jgi:DNA-binding LytR/AlgR family response regulator
MATDHCQEHSGKALLTFAMNLIAHPVVTQITEEQTASPMEVFTSLLDRKSMTRIAVKVKKRILLLKPGDVIAVLAEGNYVLLQQESSAYLLRESISTMAEKLEPFGFVRIHRSVIVNSAFVQEIQPYTTGKYGLRVKGGTEYMVTRTYKENLKSLAEFWIGSNAFFPNREQ